MTMPFRALLGSALLLAFPAVGCAGAPAAPFDTLKTANVTAFRLQNYEPPQPVPGAAATQGAGVIPGVPAEIQTWIQQGAAGLQQLIPPGLLPPGLIPGTAAPQAAPQATQIARFEGFPILGQTQVVDPDLKDELADILGHEGNFQSAHANCLYAEVGISFTSNTGAQPNNVLISFSCNQVAARNFMWPFAASGMKASTVKELSGVVAKLFPPGA
ncbi:MAG: hypothetical protein OZ921_19585 [Sorangiineae bacterium]|nr:hypothetical protein [Polyangiaceae bacterium]MEB2324727.1 hypothetical protein [Sorangiineae bacterium]